MAKEKTTGQKIKEWFKHNFVTSCLLEQKEKQFVFIPEKLLKQEGIQDLFESKEDRLDEVNSRNSLVDITEVNVIGSITDHFEPEPSVKL